MRHEINNIMYWWQLCSLLRKGTVLGCNRASQHNLKVYQSNCLLIEFAGRVQPHSVHTAHFLAAVLRAARICLSEFSA